VVGADDGSVTWFKNAGTKEAPRLGAGQVLLPARAEDKDFPVSWIRAYEKGRVFYSALGHGIKIYSNPTLLAHFLAGIQYALGDLKADSTPSGV